MLGSIKPFVLRNYLVIILIILFFIIYSIHSIARHLTLQTQAFDMGIYNQTFWLWHTGKPPFSTLNQNHIFANHFEPFLLLLLPIYNLFPSSVTLLIIQALFVSLSALPIYLLANKHLRSTLKSLLISSTYLSSTGTLYAVNYDFHSSTLAMLPLSWMIYLISTQKYLTYFIVAIFSLTFKEELVYFVGILGAYMLLIKKYPQAIISLLFALISYIFIYHYFSMQYITEINEHTLISHRNNINLSELLINPQLALRSLVVPQEKLILPIVLYGEYLLLPFGNLMGTLVSLPHILIRFLSTKQSYWELHWHYNATIQPFLAFSLITVTSKLKSNFLQKIIFSSFAVLIIMRLLYIILLPSFFNLLKLSSYNNSRLILSSIPENASVSGDHFLIPHVSDRTQIYLCSQQVESDYLVIDKRYTGIQNHCDITSTFTLWQESEYTQIWMSR